MLNVLPPGPAHAEGRLDSVSTLRLPCSVLRIQDVSVHPPSGRTYPDSGLHAATLCLQSPSLSMPLLKAQIVLSGEPMTFENIFIKGDLAGN